MEKEILRLFKGYLGETSNEVNQKALRYGLFIPSSATEEVVDEAINQYGKDGNIWNQTFHKSFDKVKNATAEQLIVEQMLHYITTYGFEYLGVYNAETVYIPREQLEIPELNNDIELINIVPLTEEQLSEKIMTLITSGIALSKQTIKDLIVLSDYIDKDKIDEIKNKEMKTALYDKYNIMPHNPDEFLRFLLFKTTEDTLKIQSKEKIREINHCDRDVALKMFKSYINDNGYDKLASIFLRNKKIFIAYKIKDDIVSEQKKELNAIINKLRKLADKNHKPMKTGLLDSLTNKQFVLKDYQTGNVFQGQDIVSALNNTTIFREIRILNGIRYRLYGDKSILFKIRNGKSFAKPIEGFDLDWEYSNQLSSYEKIIYNHLVERVSKKVNGKTICIPQNVVYAAPTSEKQFNGNFPNGSYIVLPKEDDLIYGIHWKNFEDERVDLDLKQMDKNNVFGWDASYRDAKKQVLFSGDVTDAKLPDGATELFYVDKNYGYAAFLVTVNSFTSHYREVPFEFMIAKGDSKNLSKNYIVNPSAILEKINMTVSGNDFRQKVIGLITIGDEIKFYLDDFSNGTHISSRNDDVTMMAYDYVQSYNRVQIRLEKLLEDAGAIIHTTPTIVSLSALNKEGELVYGDEKPVDIDLSPNAITKESLIKLLSDGE